MNISPSRFLVLNMAPWWVCTSRLHAFKSWIRRLGEFVRVAFSPSCPRQSALVSFYKSPSRLLVLNKAPWRDHISRLIAFLPETRCLGEFVQVAFSPSWPKQGASVSLYKSPSRLHVQNKAPRWVFTSRLHAFSSWIRRLGEFVQLTFYPSWPKRGALASLYKSPSRLLV